MWHHLLLTSEGQLPLYSYKHVFFICMCIYLLYSVIVFVFTNMCTCVFALYAFWICVCIYLNRFKFVCICYILDSGLVDAWRPPCGSTHFLRQASFRDRLSTSPPVIQFTHLHVAVIQFTHFTHLHEAVIQFTQFTHLHEAVIQFTHFSHLHEAVI